MMDAESLMNDPEALEAFQRQQYILQNAPAIAAAIMSREDPPTFIRAARDAADCAKAIYDDVTGYKED